MAWRMQALLPRIRATGTLKTLGAATHLARFGSRHFGSAEAQGLVAKVEAKSASGRPIRRDSPLYAQLLEEMDRLRAENDKILAKVDELNVSRTKLVSESSELIAAIHQGGQDPNHMAETLEKIEDLDQNVGELRSSQIQNYLSIGALKRQMVTVQKNEEVMQLSKDIYEQIGRGEAVPEDGPLAASLDNAANRLSDEFDSFSKSIAAAKKELDTVVGRVRSVELSLRARRGKADHEAETLRFNLISGLYEARRKNAQLTRYRIQQALNVKLIAVLERAREAFRFHSRIQALIDSGDKEQMEVEVASLLRGINATQKHAAELEASKATHSKEIQDVTVKLREFEDKVTPETGKLREKLIAALREEEFCIARLEVLRQVQVQDIKFLASLRQAMA